MRGERSYQSTHPWISFRNDLDRAEPPLWWLLSEAVARCDQVARAILPPGRAAEVHRVYLVKGARATTAIEGNTLSEEQVRDHLEGRLDLPPSQEYLEKEVANVLDAVNETLWEIGDGRPPRLTPEWISGANRRLLTGLEDHLAEGVVPGEMPAHPVGARRYRGAPREDCHPLLRRLCEWLEGDFWPAHEDEPGHPVGSAILRAILAHLHIAWIHPFGDGNGRTARLAEFMLLAREGVPSLGAHLLSNHYDLTRAEYHRQLDRSSRANSCRGDSLGFILYSLRGFVDGLREQCHRIERTQLRLAWEHYVYETFRGLRRSTAPRRCRKVTLALGHRTDPVRKPDIPGLTPGLARMYAARTSKTLTRDVNWLLGGGFVAVGAGGYRARVESMRAFRTAPPPPPTPSPASSF